MKTMFRPVITARVKCMAAIGAAFIVALFILTSWQFVWLPDVFTGQKRVVATLAAKSGDVIVVRQWWNRVDFYTVELRHIDQNKKSYYCVIDADSPKWWTCKLRMGASGVDVIHNGITTGTYYILSHKLTRSTGVECNGDTNEVALTSMR